MINCHKCGLEISPQTKVIDIPPLKILLCKDCNKVFRNYVVSWFEDWIDEQIIQHKHKGYRNFD